jgi:hypothetical protein
MKTSPTAAPSTLLVRLRARLQPSGPAPQPSPEPGPEPPFSPELEFAGYAEDCRIFGFLRLDAERLSDFLNAHERLRLVDVLAVALDGSRGVPADELWVTRGELLAVRASGPRGNAGRRGRTRLYPITARCGPYEVHGYLHGPPGGDPIRQLRRRPPMVPLTEAWIAYQAAGQDHRARVGTIIVNRELLDWVRPALDEEVRLPSLPVESSVDPRAKDLTGHIWSAAATRGLGTG